MLHMCMDTYAHMHASTHAHMHAQMHTHMHTCTHACTYTHMHAHTHARTHICTHTHMHTYCSPHNNTQTSKAGLKPGSLYLKQTQLIALQCFRWPHPTENSSLPCTMLPLASWTGQYLPQRDLFQRNCGPRVSEWASLSRKASLSRLSESSTSSSSAISRLGTKAFGTTIAVSFTASACRVKEYKWQTVNMYIHLHYRVTVPLTLNISSGERFPSSSIMQCLGWVAM